MDVDGAVDIRPTSHQPAVEGETRPINSGALVEIVVNVDFDEISGPHLVPHVDVPLHQHFAWLTRNTHGAVIVDQLTPAIVVAQPIDGGEIDTRLPLGLRHSSGIHSKSLDVLVHGNLLHKPEAQPACGIQCSSQEWTAPTTPSKLLG